MKQEADFSQDKLTDDALEKFDDMEEYGGGWTTTAGWSHPFLDNVMFVLCYTLIGPKSVRCKSSFPFPPFPFLSPSFPFPLPFPLEVGTPLPIVAKGSGGTLKLLQRVQAEPGHQAHSDVF